MKINDIQPDHGDALDLLFKIEKDYPELMRRILKWKYGDRKVVYCEMIPLKELVSKLRLPSI